MKKVLLTGPNTSKAITDLRFVTAPLGVHYVATYLNAHGHKAEIYDCNIALNNGKSFADIVKGDDWDMIGFSCLEATIEYDIARIHEVKRLKPNILLVAGGTGASLNYQTLFEKSPLDIVILAEGEVPMLEICNDVYLQEIDGIVFRKYAKVLNQEKWEDIRKDLNVETMIADKYWKRTASLYETPDLNEVNTFRIFTQNYCNMNCAFCTLTNQRKYSCGKTSPVLSLAPPHVISLIRKIAGAYPDVRRIFIVDDDTFLLPKRTIELCNEIISAKERGDIPDYLGFICLTNINRLNEENLPLIAKAGFKILSIGVESTSQRVLDSYNKKQTVEQIFRTTELILKHGIKPYYTLIMFSPYGTVEDLITDLHGFRRIANMGAGLSLEQYLIPLHGTRFWEKGIRQRIRECKIEGTNLSIYKGFAWLPEDPQAMEIFEVFEKIYPKFRKWRIDTDKVSHHEKNWQAHTILDCLEFVLAGKFNIAVKNPRFSFTDLLNINTALSNYKDMDIDVIGNLIEKEDLH